jgi:hypothetical protein
MAHLDNARDDFGDLKPGYRYSTLAGDVCVNCISTNARLHAHAKAHISSSFHCVVCDETHKVIAKSHQPTQKQVKAPMLIL